MLKVQVLSLRPKGKILDSYVKDFFCTKKSGLEPVRHEALRKCKAFLAECAETKVEAVVCEQSEADVKSFHSDHGACISCGKYGRFLFAKNAKRLTGETSLPVCPTGLWRLCFLRKTRVPFTLFKARSALRVRPVSPYAPLASRRG